MKLINESELFLLEEVIRRNFAAKYKDSVLGIFWSILKPLLTMIVFTIIFSTLFSRNIENFPVYFLCGRCIFDFFRGAVQVSMNSIYGNKALLNRINAPKHIFIIGGICSEFLNFLISLILLFVIMVFTHAHFYFSIMPLIAMPVVSLLIMVTGLGFMLSVLCVHFSDIQHLWSVVSILIMYASALFYPMEIIPEPYRSVMMLNPIFWAVDQFRSIIYLGVVPQTIYMLNLFLLSSIILIIGIIIYKKYVKTITMKF